ncbi:MAG: 2-dehydropantoate 2-reductase [Candidatus Sumerlaeaceae bacterium]|nr:2-dehydropantoate 2-reductase [Candidatus Sumerlaeaceae bacterium]
MHGPSEVFRGRIGVVGAGALGIFYGAKLSSAGFDVHFYVRTGYEVVRNEGYKINSCDRDFVIKPPVYHSVEEMGLCDLVLVGLKSFANDTLPYLLGPICTSRTVVLTLQNGLGNEEAIARAMVQCGVQSNEADASRQIIGGTAFLCSNRVAPNEICHTAHGFVRLAEFRGTPQARTHAIAASFRAAGIDCEVRESLSAIRWEKLLWNIPFNGLGVAAHHADTAAILSDDELYRAATEIMEEVRAAARADGVEIDPALPADLIKKTLVMGAYKSSMQIDYEQGRPLEVEAILGEPVRRARQAGIAVPKMEMLYAIVRRMDRQRQQEGV